MVEDFASSWEELETLVPDVLEGMFFADAELTDEAFDWNADTIRSAIELRHPVQGRMEVALPLDLATELCESLGVEDAPSESQLRDVAGEIVNTLAGRLQVSLAGDNEECIVGLPVTELGEPRSDRAVSGQKVFAVNDLPLIVTLMSIETSGSELKEACSS
ncbi:MAG: chemotaxis protein CheX [Myxococcales bacterium FL481]|nr:MAG: chemotaxis protein CheX [Myxococcales bacterium FL481]